MKMLNRVDWGTRVVLFVGETSLLAAQEAQALVRHTKAYNLQLSKAAGVAEPYTGGESQMTEPITVFLLPETKGDTLERMFERSVSVRAWIIRSKS